MGEFLELIFEMPFRWPSCQDQRDSGRQLWEPCKTHWTCGLLVSLSFWTEMHCFLECLKKLFRCVYRIVGKCSKFLRSLRCDENQDWNLTPRKHILWPSEGHCELCSDGGLTFRQVALMWPKRHAAGFFHRIEHVNFSLLFFIKSLQQLGIEVKVPFLLAMILHDVIFLRL